MGLIVPVKECLGNGCTCSELRRLRGPLGGLLIFNLPQPPQDWVTSGQFSGGESFGFFPGTSAGGHETDPAILVNVEVFPAIALSP